MKNTLVKRILRFALLGAVLMGSLVVAGCGKKQKISDSKASEVMKEMLYEKYGEEFEVSESWRLTNTDMGMPGIGGGWSYCADVYTEDGQTFQVAIDNDGNNFKDSYCKIVFEEALQEYVYELVSVEKNVEIEDYHSNFYMDSYNWSDQDNIEAFLKSTETYVTVDVQVSATSKDELVQKCYNVSKQLETHNVEAIISFWYDGKDITVVIPFEEESEEAIIQRLRKKVENAIESM